MKPKIGIELDNITSLYMEILINRNLMKEKVLPWARQQVLYIAEAGRDNRISFPAENLTKGNAQDLIDQWVGQRPGEVLRLWIDYQSNLPERDLPVV